MKHKAERAIEFLLERGSLPVLYWLKRDILDVPYEREIRNLRKYAARIRILENQKSDGSWCEKVIENSPFEAKTRAIADTLKNLFLLSDYGCLIEDEGIVKGIEYLLATQSKVGDFRRAASSECAPAFHALALEVLCRYGLDGDRRVQKGFRWLQGNFDQNGRWIFHVKKVEPPPQPPPSSRKKSLASKFSQKLLLQKQKERGEAFSRFMSGFTLRAFAESPTWRNTKTARQTAEVLLNAFFGKEAHARAAAAKADVPTCWDNISYPFWTSGFLSHLDSLSRIGFNAGDERIRKALDWLMRRQTPFGYWEPEGRKTTAEDHLWVTLSVLRILKRFKLLGP